MSLKTAVIVDSFGRIVKSFSNASDDFIKLNQSPKEIIIFTSPPKKDAYWDGGIQQFVELPDKPSKYHTFDYAIKEWVDLRTLDEIKAQKWVEIKSERDRIEFGGFEFEGDIYDSDQVSQGRILGASIAGVDQVWTLANNSTISLSASQLQQLYAALQTHTALVHERGRIAREAIMSATTKEDVEAVTL